MSITKMDPPVTTNHRTYELLAEELIGRFPERAVRRLNNIKRRKEREKYKSYEKENELSWHTEWERKREARAKERQRKIWWNQDET